ncbi:single-stranded-DNA-specific exonuclease RecJ [Paenibacillus macquariensis]|uniref:Single-stranded-DNA-specific exonuclease RecJ n=1 Tax=Paenibacillus macquariensis TaxID=948756 RepID=A0ABY1K203_9BACL|nr:single-stranded-DNA-specific exonuclease RecJ [Paenibacillus macquariensis]MEC0091661.1 single-stranded-DNA-specific exonuclease RecJ [Paenibacillus macquariensis]OAB32409.1 single-stranded-DNA-specific exonuclease RecJ [Paenibacillus macquariensis subsp. macquariensis]SIR14527.1 single-stranded-DNA-specific exonuclease [Paenibacillus macquariensis]
MLHSKYKWQPQAYDANASQQFAEVLSISPLLASLLISRGICTVEEANMFIKGNMDDLHDPFLLHGMTEAVPRILQAVDSEEHILVYGDYDADGVSSTSLMIHLMRHMGASYDIYIPHRSNEGYGLHNHAIDWAHQQGVSLMITVDTGISAVEQVAYANSLGIDVIITDHHEPPEILPNAYALINPKLSDCSYPYKGLAGVGVAYKLCQALLGNPPIEWTELVAIGTVADLMPLTGENRILVQTGITSMRKSSFQGIQALLEVSGIVKETVTSTNIAFGMAPRINASGRLDHAGRAVSLLTTEDSSVALGLAHELDNLNKQRQQVVEDILQEALAQLETKIQNGGLPSVIVLAGKGWNVGVVGIVASKILERYYRPVLILGIDEETGTCKGSARSISELDMYAALTSCKHLMDHYGGHPAAAGMSLHIEQLSEFESALNQYAKTILVTEDLMPVVDADGEWKVSDLPISVIEELELLQPFGMANPVPRFIIRDIVLQESRTMGRDHNHLRLTMQQGNSRLEAVAFGQGNLSDLLTSGTSLDVIGELTINEWNGSRKLQLMLHDLAISEPQVYDLRGVKEPQVEINRYLQLMGPRLRGQSAQVGVLFEEKRLTDVRNHLNELSLWVYDKNGGMISSNSVAEQGKDDITTLFVLDAPQSPRQLDDMMTTYKSLRNIVLLHAMDVPEKLQVPDRELFKKLYILLSRIGSVPVSERDVLSQISRQSSTSVRMLSMMMDVFEELSFIERSQGFITLVLKPPKKDLDDSIHFRELGNLAEMEQNLFHSNTIQLTNWMITLLKAIS